MNILKRYNNFFTRELVRVEFKFYMRKNAIIENLIFLSNNDNNYLFYNISSLLLISRNKKRVIK